MDYIKEINAFYDQDWPHRLTPQANLVYLALLNLANRRFWPQELNVSDAALLARTGLGDRRTLERARQLLAEEGLIYFREGEQGRVYRLASLVARARIEPQIQTGLAVVSPERMKTPGRRKVKQELQAAAATENDEWERLQDCTVGEARCQMDYLPADNKPMGILPENSTGEMGELQEDSQIDKVNLPENYRRNPLHPPSKPLPDQASSPTQTNTKTETKTYITKPDDSVVATIPVNDGKPGTNQELIAELTREYRQVPGVAATKGDYPFIGALYNEYGYEQVLYGIHELSMAAVITTIQKPLVYLKGILRRAGPAPGTISNPNVNSKSREEEDPSERYERERYRG